MEVGKALTEFMRAVSDLSNQHTLAISSEAISSKALILAVLVSF